MSTKKYKPSFVVKYLYKNKKKYNDYFDDKIKNIKFNVFFSKLTKDYIDYVQSQKLTISFNPWDVTSDKKLVYGKMYNKSHKNGWTISGVIDRDYVSFVPIIYAYHKTYGYVYGNFSEEINVVSDNTLETLKHFLDNNPPLIWTEYDI